MSIIYKSLLKNTTVFCQPRRLLFHWINLQFNALDEERTKTVGPDRTCAEWILRNGGAVKWVNSNEALTDYNELPQEGRVLHLQEVDASNSSVMQNGFVHFKGCNYITKIIFHDCTYLEDEAFAELRYLKNSLLDLEVSNCPNISDKGLSHLKILTKLKRLVMYDLISVKNMEKVVQDLKNSLPQCTIKLEK